MGRAERTAVVIRSVGIQAVVLAIFAAFGTGILKFMHVSVGAMEIAGGIILFVFALGLVLGEEHAHDEAKPVGDISIYPMAVPLLATPQAIVAITVIFARAPDAAARMNAWIALGLLIVANLALLGAIAHLMQEGADKAKKGSGFAGVLLRIVAILLAALAVELIVLGLREYGVLPAAVGRLAH